MLTSKPSDKLTAGQVLDLIFRDPEVRHGLGEFDDLGKPADQILSIFPLVATTGRFKGEIRYYVKCLKRGENISVLSEKRSNPEEIVRQLWLYKLHHVYKYPFDHIAVEHSVNFGTITAPKSADIVVFQKDGKTAKIILEVKKPERKDGINQLKSYLNAEGSPVGVWSNGKERIILYRPYPQEFDDTLTEIPFYGQEPKDVLAAKLTLGELKREFDFKDIIENLEELVLANSGVDEFNEIFKIIFAKLYDEKAAKDRKNQEVDFRKAEVPQVTYERIDGLFRKAMEEWPGTFDENEHIKLTPQHLQIVIGPLERIRLLGANMRVMDDAFEYLMPTVAKKKNGQFFTPRYVIDMCVKMLNPKRTEYVLDPACGSAGFLIHAMEYVWPAVDDAKKEERKHIYAARYLWGFDFDERSARVARALMLIAGDGRTHVFRVNSLDPKEWFTDEEGEGLRASLREAGLLIQKPPGGRAIAEAEAWDFYREMKFDMILTNPPFAGEIRDRALLQRYELAQPAITRKSEKGPKEERDVLFIERCLDLLKPGGRLAIVLPQGKFNNASLGYIRAWVLRRARLLAVVGLHGNTFRPHTGTKTSILFVRKYTEPELGELQYLADSLGEKAPDYRRLIEALLEGLPSDHDLDEEQLPDEVREMLHEVYPIAEEESVSGTEEGGKATDEESGEAGQKADAAVLEEEIDQQRRTLAEIEARLAEAVAKRSELNSSRKLLKVEEFESRRLALREEEVQLRAVRKEAVRGLEEREHELALATIRGRLGLMMADDAALRNLTQRWIDHQIAAQLNEEVFMATSERGGKDSSGRYVFRVDADSHTATDAMGNPLIDQDCVAYGGFLGRPKPCLHPSRGVQGTAPIPHICRGCSGFHRGYDWRIVFGSRGIRTAHRKLQDRNPSSGPEPNQP